MDLIYKKSDKGHNEILSRSHGLARQLRPYLIVVDGNKSVKNLATINSALKDLPSVLEQLHADGFITT